MCHYFSHVNQQLTPAIKRLTSDQRILMKGRITVVSSLGGKWIRSTLTLTPFNMYFLWPMNKLFKQHLDCFRPFLHTKTSKDSQCFSVGWTTLRIALSPVVRGPIEYVVCRIHPSQPLTRHLDRFSCFCRAHKRYIFVSLLFSVSFYG